MAPYKVYQVTFFLYTRVPKIQEKKKGQNYSPRQTEIRMTPHPTPKVPFALLELMNALGGRAGAGGRQEAKPKQPGEFVL